MNMREMVLYQIDEQRSANAINVAARLPCSVRDVWNTLSTLENEGVLRIRTEGPWPVYERPPPSVEDLVFGRHDATPTPSAKAAWVRVVGELQREFGTLVRTHALMIRCGPPRRRGPDPVYEAWGPAFALEATYPRDVEPTEDGWVRCEIGAREKGEGGAGVVAVKHPTMGISLWLQDIHVRERTRGDT